MIYYEKHPVSAERKAELNAKGYRIIDAAYAPSDWVDPEAKPEPVKPARNARRKANEPSKEG